MRLASLISFPGCSIFCQLLLKMQNASSLLCVGALLMAMVVTREGFALEQENQLCSKTAAGYHEESEDVLAVLCVGEAEEITLGHKTDIVACIRSEESSSLFTLALQVEQEWIASTIPQVEIEAGNCSRITIDSISPGVTHLSFKCPNQTGYNSSCPFAKRNLRLSRRRISISRFFALSIVIEALGWIYAFTGIISFYPQIYHNFRRQSVEGLSFDFLGLNFTGGLAYAMFNLGLYLIPQVKREYFHRHPGGVNPVLLNDVVFSANAAFAQGLLILQCFALKRGKQRLSWTAILLITLLWLVLIVTLCIAIEEVIVWLDYLYIVSYIKLAVTPIKYIPQVWTNFQFKSTVGFSVGYSLLEVISGSFSVFQMFVLSYNYNDWKSIFGDPTKFGFGALTVVFALILSLQHLLYRSNSKAPPNRISKSDDLASESSKECSNSIQLKRHTALDKEERRVNNETAFF